MAFDESRFPILLGQLYGVVVELEAMCERPFTPDGHMVGSIVECLAAHYYGLALLKCSNKGTDATFHGRAVEIKGTQGNKSVSLRSGPEHLLVLRLFPDATFEEVYNGLGDRVWHLFRSKTAPSNGQHPVTLSKLRQLMLDVSQDERIPRLR